MRCDSELKIFRNVATLLIFAVSTSHAQTPLSAGKGKDEFNRICSTCHSPNIATNQRKSSAEWTATVIDMVSRGADATSGEVTDVIAYLSSNFNSSSVTSVQVEKSHSTQVAAELSNSISSLELEQGRLLVKTKGCLQCHRVERAGSYMGPDLNTVGAHLSLDQIRTIIASPAKNLKPQNRSVHIVTSKGKVITGKLLNHDGFSIQLIDSSSRLQSIQQADTREVTILNESPIPFHIEKLSDEDLATIARYLSSLK